MQSKSEPMEKYRGREGEIREQPELQYKFGKNVVHNLHEMHSAPHCDLSLSV